MVLLGLAEHAHPDGSEARPAVATLARYAECDERTVRRHLRKLEDAGIILTDTPRDARRRRGRPIEFRISLGALAQRSDNLSYPLGQDVQGGSGDLPDEPVLQPVPNLDLSFDRFWKIYPKRVGRKPSRAAFERALRTGVELDRILAGAIAYRDDARRDPGYTLNPLTWLNQARWEDEMQVDSPSAEMSATDWEAYYRDQDERIRRLLEQEGDSA